MHVRTGFGADVAEGAAEDAARLHFRATTIGFSSGGAVRTASGLPDADVLLVVGGFDDELAAAPALLGREWRAVGFVGAGVDEVLAPLGQAREGLLGPAQWVAAAASESDEGPDVQWFLTRYRSAVGNDPPYPATQSPPAFSPPAASGTPGQWKTQPYWPPLGASIAGRSTETSASTRRPGSRSGTRYLPCNGKAARGASCGLRSSPTGRIAREAGGRRCLHVKGEKTR